MTKFARLTATVSIPLFAFAGCAGDDDDAAPSAGSGGRGGKGGSAGMMALAGSGDTGPGGEAGTGTGSSGAAGDTQRGGSSGKESKGGSGGVPIDETGGSAGEETGSGGAAVHPTIRLAESNAEYATVVALDLASLGLPTNLTLSRVQVTQGKAQGLVVASQQLRFITPSDPGTNTSVELSVELPTKTYVIPLMIRSARPSEVVAYVDSAATDEEVPSLQVAGLGSTNALVGALSFSVDGAPTLDPGASSGTIYLPTSDTTLNLADYWVYDSGDNALKIDGTQMTSLLAALPSTDVELTISLTSENGAFAYAWSFAAHKPSATLHGAVVDFDSMPSTALAGRLMGIRGNDNRTRRVVTVAADGTFTADALVDGTYDVTLLDPTQPGFWKATVPIFSGSTDVDLSFPYAAASSAKRLGGSSTSLLSGRTLRATTRQNGTLPTSRRQTAALAVPTECEVAGIDDSLTYSALANAQNTTITCIARPEIPKGTQKVGVLIEVTSDEYPQYTQQKSQYNDTWSYAVAGIPGLGGASGAVNDTHYTQGTISKEVCLDVATLTATGPFSFQANLGATNIGDSALPTYVTMTVTPDCSDKLTVTDATFSSPNEAGYDVIRPTGRGNLDANYVSIPTTAAATTWGIPLTVRYLPASAKLTGVRLGIMVDGYPLFASDDILSQATSKTAGVLAFKNLVLPTFDIQTFPGKTSLVVELTGTIDGEPQTSDPASGAIAFASQNTFVPLFLLDDPFTEQRYGQRDSGGDSWATVRTLDWLTSRLYRFDDISGLHVAQTAAGRSALDHAGHSDGMQVDMRYADGTGTFTDQLGGASDGAYIKQLLNAAASEVATGATDTPKLTQTLAWIAANRSMIEGEQYDARNIYVGPSWMKLALYNGKFPKGTAIPGAGVWTTKPPIVSFVAPHLHHWHVSLKQQLD